MAVDSQIKINLGTWEMSDLQEISHEIKTLQSDCMCNDSRQILRTMRNQFNDKWAIWPTACPTSTDKEPEAAGWESKKLMVLVFYSNNSVAITSQGLWPLCFWFHEKYGSIPNEVQDSFTLDTNRCGYLRSSKQNNLNSRKLTNRKGAEGCQMDRRVCPKREK